MSRTIEQVRDILYGSHRCNAGLQWYDFLLARGFYQDGTGEMMYGESQALRSDMHFRYEISADMHIHFDFFILSMPPGRLSEGRKMFEKTEENGFKTVSILLLMVHLSSTNLIISRPIIISCVFLQTLFHTEKGILTWVLDYDGLRE